MVIGRVEQKTNIRFRFMDDFESFMKATDIEYDSEDVTFTGYVYKKLIHLNSKLLNGVLLLKVLLTWMKLLNIVDETVVYQIPECVLSTVFIILLMKFIQKNFGIPLEMRNIDQKW